MSRPRDWTYPSTACGAIPSSTFRFRAGTGRKVTVTSSVTCTVTRRQKPKPHSVRSILRYQFVDCRWELGKPGRGRELYLEGHVPGASFLDVDSDLSSAPGARGRHPLPEPASFAQAASRAGIGDGVFVVAYGNMGGAERLWWLLRHFGHDACAVMELSGWRGRLARGDERIQPATFVPQSRDDDTIEAEELARRHEELLVLDARLPSRWRGEDNPIDTRPGRIPGALNAPWNESSPELRDGELVA